MKINNALCYSFSLNAQEPMAYIRLIAPFQHAGIQIINGLENGLVVSEFAQNVDIVIIQREFPTRYEDYRTIFEIAKENKIPVVFELDDLLFFLPDFHTDKHSQYYSPTLLPMFQALLEVDLVIVSSQKMRNVLAKFNTNIAVLPNYFDDNCWDMRPPLRKNSSGESITIGYMGTKSHKPDLDYIAPVLLDLIEHYNEKINFQFWGIQPPAELTSLPQVKWSSHYFQSYRDFAVFFQNQSADIFIAPLVDNLFNRCKSAIKFFEYSALGAPGIYSRLEPYQEVIVHGENGLLASSLTEWRECLIRLIENDELRFQLATHAQSLVKEDMLLSQNAYRWQEALDRAFKITKRSDHNTETLRFVKSINQQLDTLLQDFSTQITKKYNEIQNLTTQSEKQLNLLHATEDELKIVKRALDGVNNELSAVKQELNQAQDEIEQLRAVKFELNEARQKIIEMQKEIEQLQAEVLNYVLSKSWQLTRPFRKIKKRLDKLAG
jgi:glycosyltransferase involved in cell wall biosynthesis